jgi:hypothetical protein
MIIEQNTNYAYKLKYTGSPSFEKIRGLSSKFFLELPKELQDQLHEALNRGVDELDSEPLMVAYLFSFGKMHQAKLNYAFKHLPEEFLLQSEINIIDYGCGQALGTMCYADFLRENGYEQKVKTITLIEPSEICLKRAALHASAFFPDAEINTVNKKFDDLTQDDIVCNEETPTLHILSNVLDMLNFNLERFAELVKGCLKGYNQFVCVGPYFGKNDRSKRMDDFANNLMEDIIYTADLNSFELDPNYSWTCMVRCFGVGNLGIALHKEKAETVNSNVKPLFINFLTYKGMRRVFLGMKEIINPVTNQKERWQELLLGTLMDDPNAEIIRISSELGTINTSFLIQNKDILQVFSHPNYKHKILCIEDRPESTLRENLSTEVTDEAIEKGIKDEYGMIYSKNGKRLLSAKHFDCETYTINKGIKVICDRAFFCCKSLQSIVIPNSVTSIGHSAFQDCASLQSIVIPESVTSIGDWAFESCKSLQSIAIPESVTNIRDWAFASCESLQSIVIPENVTSIGDSAFASCKSLQSLAIPESVTNIGDSAFSFCTSLQSIVIPESVTSIGANPFVDSGVRSIVCHSKFFKVDGKAMYDQNKKHLIAFYSNCSHFVIPGSVTSIGDSAFSFCTSLQSIAIPESVTSIGDSAFSFCTSLQSIVIPKSVTNIGDSAFSFCTSLQSIVIPKSVTSVGEKAFSFCISLQSIVIPESVTSIGDWAFKGCHTLQSIVIPNSVTSIGDLAFKGCKSLRTIIIPKGSRKKFEELLPAYKDKLVEK